MTKSRILHLARDEKFINAANFLFEQAFPQQNTFLILMTAADVQLKYVTAAENVEQVVAGPGYAFELLAMLEDYDVIAFHGLDALRRQVILKASESERRKFLWVYWGSEIYREGLWDQSLYGPKTLKLFFDLAPAKAPSPTQEQINRNKEAIFHLQRLAIQAPEETEFFRERGAIHEDTVSVPFTYYPLEYLFGDLNQRISGNDVLLGNSASFSNNHLEALDLLAEFDLKEQQVYLPLSYGEVTYGDAIAAYAEEKFPGRVVAMRKFMPIHEYNRTIASCGVVIMNHYRQQGFGNILAFIYLGAKVFLNDTSIYRYLKRIGCSVFSISDDLKADQPGVLSPLTEQEVARNREVLFKEISTAVVVEKLRDSVTEQFGLSDSRVVAKQLNQEAPVVDVLMPVFNIASSLKDSIDSVLKQSITNLRLIIVDDGSTDNSWRIIETIAKRDSRILCFKQEHQGVLQAKNRLLELASSEFISWVESGDVIQPNRLEKHLEVLRRYPAVAAVTSDLGYVNSKRVDRAPRDSEELKVRAIFESVVKDPGTIRRSTVEQLGVRFLDVALEGAENDWFWSKLVEKQTVAVVREALYLHRPQSAQERDQKSALQRSAHQENICRQLGKFGIDVSAMEDKTALYSNGKSRYSKASVMQAGEIYQQLLKKNRELKLCSQQHLERYLANNYRGLSRRIGPVGVLQYIRVMGLRKLLQGHYFGLLFIRDCLFRNQ